MDARHAATQETRSRILEASLRLLGSEAGITAFTIESVAREAGVARMTVYYQFSSRQGLLEAVYDELGARGLVQELPAVLTATNRRDAIERYVYAFCRFWAADRLVMRRVRALARLDPDFEAGVHARDERRRQICRTVLSRYGSGSSPFSVTGDTMDVVLMLTSFETFDALAIDGRGFDDVVTLLQGLVLNVAREA
jgi:AcrR family transcriptional regulator